MMQTDHCSPNSREEMSPVNSKLSKKRRLNLTIQSQTDNLMLVRDFVSDAARNFGFSDEEISKIALAVDEACTNIIKHAYNFDPTKDIMISIVTNGGKFVVMIRDKGKWFNPENIPMPNMHEYLTQFKVGGLGMYLMKKLMDEVEYNIQPGVKNEVKLVKYLHRGAE
jgi:serine/threonine-protein kinase RsbW